MVNYVEYHSIQYLFYINEQATKYHSFIFVISVNVVLIGLWNTVFLLCLIQLMPICNAHEIVKQEALYCYCTYISC